MSDNFIVVIVISLFSYSLHKNEERTKRKDGKWVNI